MSDCNNLPQQENSAPPEKSGCMTYLGVILLITAVAAVLLCFIVKPALEEKGVDVQSELEDIKSRAGDTVNSVKSRLQDTGENISEKYGELKESADKISKSETVEKIKEKAGEIKKTEVFNTVAEKTENATEKIVEKAKDGESWY